MPEQESPSGCQFILFLSTAFFGPERLINPWNMVVHTPLWIVEKSYTRGKGLSAGHPGFLGFNPRRESRFGLHLCGLSTICSNARLPYFCQP